MLCRLILGLAAAALVGMTLMPVDALARHRAHKHWLEAPGLKVCNAGHYGGWNPFSRDPGQRGYPGPHYGCDCYRAANGRAMCSL
jgi:hypothetical protein